MEKGTENYTLLLMAHSIRSGEPNFLSYCRGLYLLYLKFMQQMKANGCIIQLDTLAFLSCAEVVGGKKEHVTTVSQLCSSRSTVLSSRQRTCL